MIARKWNAEHGGVYVLKKPGVKSNPYLEKPDIFTIDNKTYTMRNPALMLREISEYTEKGKGAYRFHITSERPINPDNRPDEFEKKGFSEFKKGAVEYFCDACIENEFKFKYVAPLFVDVTCLKCHAKQGYKTGDVRGAISVSFDITNLKQTYIKNTRLIIILSIATIIVVIGAIGLLTFILIRRLSRAYDKINDMAVTDELTSLHNRYYFFPKLQHVFAVSKRYKHPLSCILIDIDNFKIVNDRHGHQAGDTILKSMSGIITNNCRKTDIISRFGGEEIIILLPETPGSDAVNLAEKLRSTISEYPFSYNGTEIYITVSFGVSGFSAIEIDTLSDINKIIKNADQALYIAKEKGKNRVEIFQE